MKFSRLESLESRRLCAVDLSITSAEFPIGVFAPDASVPLAISVRNDGTTGVITPFSGRIYLSKNGKLDDLDFQVGTFTISSLPAQTTSSLIATIELDNQVPKGTYRGFVMVDTGLQIAESNENNNVAISFMTGFTVLGSSAAPRPVQGTEGNDVIRITQNASTISLQVNDVTTELHSGDISQFVIETAGGNDQVFIDPSVATPSYVLGGVGDDTIVGGSAADTLTGAAGKDRIDGGLGNDLVNGSGGNDRVGGGAGADRVYGGDGNDFLDGGTSGDRLFGGSGIDVLVGGNGNDFLHSLDGQTDTLHGDAGTDTAEEDPQDVLNSIEV